MNVILLKNIDNLGDKHDIISVKDGYGRNYLIPQGLALVANATNKGKLADMMRKQEAKENKMIGDFQAVADKLKGVVLRIVVKSGTTGKIFGSVTNVQLSQALRAQADIDIERKKIHIEEEVKELGTYTAKVELHKQVPASVAFEVVAD
jgi:large subunit ribosomal protein L9